MTGFEDIRKHVDEAIRIVQQGNGSRRYGSGARLVRELNEAARIAVLRQEWVLAQRLQRFAAYVVGELPLNVVEMFYDPRAKAHQERFMRKMLALGAERAVAALNELLRANADATAADAREFFRGVARAVDHIGVGDGEGGVRLSPRDADRLRSLGEMELIVNRLPDSASSDAARFLEDLFEAPDAGLFAQLVELRARRRSLEELRVKVEEPNSSEGDLHGCLKDQWWIFGGVYVRELPRRQYTPDEVLDLPLLRGDGSLHVVELKRANIKDLVIRTGGHLMLGAKVHRAVSQAQNYLRVLDENRDQILRKHGIDCRRASATVVIGHPKYLRNGVSANEAAETLRTYNSHSARIEVITYETLLDSASRMLAISSANNESYLTEEDE
ncbi:Shedu anti-phage system protein SduA domain-containing protein [Actinomadura kijaniata]|uniref:Shedu anti-phage system protein SduA domain-containing protein n=1 Tax=Actinomadura kijaniata TaxID=46161 RepID=UPI003F1C10EA